MDVEIWIGGCEVVDKGWVDVFLEFDEIFSVFSNCSEVILVKCWMDVVLVCSGML